MNFIVHLPSRPISLSQITLSELGDHAKGYRGGDAFSVLEGVLVRRFPLYPDDQPDYRPI